VARASRRPQQIARHVKARLMVYRRGGAKVYQLVEA
jgi:hypothetical protein